jgi:outer membrane protein TolC
MRARSIRNSVLLLALSLSACTLEPEGTDAEFGRLHDAGAAWRAPPDHRELPELPPAPDASDVLARALLANAGLEAAWHDWRAALEGVLVASGWPNTDLSVGLTSFVAHGDAWDTGAVSLGFDPMQMLLLPAKVRQAGEAAFHEALAAGRRFEAERLALRAEVLAEWAAWSALGERLTAGEQDVALLESLERQARAAVGAGAAQALLLEGQVALADARNALAVLRAEADARRATLNARLLREPEAPLAAPAAPAARPRPPDAQILRLGVAANPELAALEHEAAARGEAAGLAELRWFPNVAPSAQAGGGMDESLGLGFTFPTTVPAVRAGIRQARAQADAAAARLRQGALDARAALLAALADLRAREQVLDTLRGTLEPAALAVEANARQAYVNGAGDLPGLVEAQRALLELRVAVAQALAEREARLAEVERLAGVDLTRLQDTVEPLAAVAAGDLP